MKNIYLFFGVLFALSAKAQENKPCQKMIEAEMKSAMKVNNVVLNPNTYNYDLTYAKLEFTVNPASSFIEGKVTSTYIAIENMTSLTFDLVNNMVVSSVKINGIAKSFTQPATKELVINIAGTQATGTSAIVEIIYSGNFPPASPTFDAIVKDVHNGTPVLWTLSEPFGAREWWPCKQDLNDKINSIDIYITAPSQYTSVANGIEPNLPVTVGALKTTHFYHSYPIAAYLIAIAVSNYQVYIQQAGLGTLASPYFPIINYIYPETAAANIDSVVDTPAIMNFYESKFGPYPFRNEKYGHCQFAGGGGMEHTTVSFMESYDGTGGYDRDLIAHELGHQWFGNKITCGSWKDIWLNEGITEYLSGLTVEFLDGNTAFRNWKSAKTTNITSVTTGTSNLYLTDAQALSSSRIFSNRITYDKGSMVNNMLRYKMGDVMYFQALNNYISSPMFSYNYAITTDYKLKLEQVYGSSLTEFFNDWVYGQGFPRYNISVQNLVGNQAKITVNQTQSSSVVSYFEMPLEIKVNGAAGATQTLRVDNTSNNQEFIVPTNFLISSVSFDPEKNIISKGNIITLNPVLGTLANDSFELSNAILLSPNPANDYLKIEMPSNIEFENAQIFNLLGQKILESNANIVSISSLSNGIYSISIKTSEGNISKKFIKN